MKKQKIALMLLALTLISAGCSKKPEETTAAAASVEETTAAETTEASEEETEREEASVTGEITAVNGDIVTVRSDDDQTEYQLDISQAEVVRSSFNLMTGDKVYADYYEGETSPLTAFYFEVEESVLASEMDPLLTGTVIDAAMNTITISTEDGEVYTFRTSNAYIVAKNGITTDKQAQITYIGELDDEPMAARIVMEDSYETPEAAITAFIGTVAGLTEEGGIIVEAEGGDFFTFVSDDLDFSDYSEGSTVQIQYEGSLMDKEITATSISAK